MADKTRGTIQDGFRLAFSGKDHSDVIESEEWLHCRLNFSANYKRTLFLLDTAGHMTRAGRCAPLCYIITRWPSILKVVMKI